MLNIKYRWGMGISLVFQVLKFPSVSIVLCDLGITKGWWTKHHSWCLNYSNEGLNLTQGPWENYHAQSFEIGAQHASTAPLCCQFLQMGFKPLNSGLGATALTWGPRASVSKFKPVCLHCHHFGMYSPLIWLGPSVRKPQLWASSKFSSQQK